MTASLLEAVARQLCADGGSSGFCCCVGGSLGCKVGRGQPFDGTNCKASKTQLMLAGYVGTATAILQIVRKHEERAQR